MFNIFPPLTLQVRLDVSVLKVPLKNHLKIISCNNQIHSDCSFYPQRSTSTSHFVGTLSPCLGGIERKKELSLHHPVCIPCTAVTPVTFGGPNQGTITRVKWYLFCTAQSQAQTKVPNSDCSLVVQIVLSAKRYHTSCHLSLPNYALYIFPIKGCFFFFH